MFCLFIADRCVTKSDCSSGRLIIKRQERYTDVNGWIICICHGGYIRLRRKKKSKQLSVRKCIVWVNRLRSLKSARINSLPVTQHEGKNVSFNSSFIGKSSVLCTIWQKLNKASNCINLPRLNAV